MTPEHHQTTALSALISPEKYHTPTPQHQTLTSKIYVCVFQSSDLSNSSARYDADIKRSESHRGHMGAPLPQLDRAKLFNLFCQAGNAPRLYTSELPSSICQLTGKRDLFTVQPCTHHAVANYKPGGMVIYLAQGYCYVSRFCAFELRWQVVISDFTRIDVGGNPTLMVSSKTSSSTNRYSLLPDKLNAFGAAERGR
ncbi:hypothetical protein Bbelb_207800 [Branchiostoma belcheri]|nr:hypothetical protein Bbelb_207800 [Branchiostoma belcheri]